MPDINSPTRDCAVPPHRGRRGARRRHIAILGGGYAGIATAIKLLDTSTEPLHLSIVEPRAKLGRGIAYSTRESAHLMNGPAKLFSIHAERPERFVQYLARFAHEGSGRGKAAAETLLVDGAINCTGATYDRTRSRRTLAANLLARGLIRPGPLSCAIDADRQAAVIGQDGARASEISAIGPTLRGVRSESNTFNELLEQAIQTADRLTALQSTTAELSYAG